MPAQRGVARTGLFLAGALALCRIASLGKEMLVAGRFGAGDTIDAYALAMLVVAAVLAVPGLARAYNERRRRRRAQQEQQLRQHRVGAVRTTALIP